MKPDAGNGSDPAAKNDTSSQKPVRGYGPVVAILVVIGSYFLSQFIVGALLSLLSPLVGWDSTQLFDWLEYNVTGQFVVTVLVQAITLAIVWRFMKYRGVKLSDIGLVRPRMSNIGQAATGYLMYMAAFLLLSYFVAAFLPEVNLEQEQQIGFDRATTGPALLLVFASLVLLPAFVEEIMIRGFLYTGLRSKLPKIIAALVASLLFGVAHLQFGSGAALLWVAAIDTFVLSMILIYLREKSDSLWPPIIVHLAKNGMAFTFLFLLS